MIKGLLLLCILMASAVLWTVPAQGSVDQPGAGDVIPGRYIVVLHERVDPLAVARRHGLDVRHIYYATLNGFAARLDEHELAAVRRLPGVKYVEPDRVLAVTETQYMDGDGDPWGLDRIDQRARPLSGSYTYSSDRPNAMGAGVHAYVIDTGIDSDHSDFGGRARNVYSAYHPNGEDCSGHGTHVAGILGSSTYGVAKAVQLYGVNVTKCSGQGDASTALAGIDWVRVNHEKPAVVNMSWTMHSIFRPIQTAVEQLAAEPGVFVAVAAGNGNRDACTGTPANARGAFTVAASDRSDKRAGFSGYGPCVDGYAPGVEVLSTGLDTRVPVEQDGTSETRSGTSQAAPHVAGVAALLWSVDPEQPDTVIGSALTELGVRGVIEDNPEGTPNWLLQKGNF